MSLTLLRVTFQGPILETGPANPAIKWIFGILTGIIVILLILNRKGYNALYFRYRARAMGLKSDLIDILEECVRLYSPRAPYSLLQNGKTLNYCLKQALKATENDSGLSQSAREAKRFKIYKIKRLIELNSSLPRQLVNTHDLSAGDKLIVNALETPQVTAAVKVLKVKEKTFIISMPDFKGPAGSWSAGTKFQAVYLGRYGEEYIFQARVGKVVESRKEKKQVYLSCPHISRVLQVRRRKTRRKQLNYDATVYPVEPGQNLKSRQEPRLGFGARCLLLDISLGGCALQTGSPFKTDSAVCLQFYGFREKIVCYGTVLDCHEAKPRSFILRIKFFRASKASVNNLSDLIYGL